MDSGERILRGMPRRGARSAGGSAERMVAVAVDQAHDHHRTGPRRSLCVSLVDGAFLDSVVVVRKYRLPDGADDEVHLGGYRLRGGCAAGGFFAANWNLALRRRESASRSGRLASSRVLRWPLWLLTVALALFAGWFAAEQCDWRLAFAGTSFGIADPVFGMDAGFYVFRLPALEIAHRAALTTALVTLVAVALIYLGMRGLDRLDQLQATPQTRRHLLGLAALLLVLFGAGYCSQTTACNTRSEALPRAGIRRDRGAATQLSACHRVGGRGSGPRLQPAHGTTPLARNNRRHMADRGGPGSGGAATRATGDCGAERIAAESQYIANNIALTRTGFGLDGVDSRSISGQGEPPASALQADSPVLRNVRLWDYRIARETFQQLRSFVPYYVFNDVDVDRYPEEDELQQVLVSARELDTEGLPANAQTWTNQHLSYTHGYGGVVSPINEATSQGLPVFSVGRHPARAGWCAHYRPAGNLFRRTGEHVGCGQYRRAGSQWHSR